MSDATEKIASEVPATPVEYGSPDLLRDVESFLAYDSELLDGWRLSEWLELFTPDCRYLVPTTDKPDGDPHHDLFFVRDDYFLLSERVAAMLDGTAWTESPHSTTHRMISNVRARELGDGRIEAKANLLVHRARAGRLDAYPAHLTLLLVRGGRAGFEIVERKAVLAMEQLRPHGRVSILL
jgi:3-phenylpropionate/cinnamic acid dioxygenase small subunit